MAQKLPKGSLILVSGANGYIASHVIDHLLASGYRVRGTVRDFSRTAWLKPYFHQKYPDLEEDSLEIVLVPDASQPHAFDDAIKSCSAFAHIASDLSMNPDPTISVNPTISSVRNALDAATREKSIKSFVLTSSSTAAITARPNQVQSIDESSWNEEAIRLAFTEPHDDNPRKRWACYAASKALSEQAAWNFIREHSPHFTFNTILPNANFGAMFDPVNQHGSAAGWIRAAFKPDIFAVIVSNVAPQWFVHPSDTARLHVACLTELELNNERLLAFAERFSWNEVLGMLRRIVPARVAELPGDAEGDERDLTCVANERALEVLRVYCGQEGWLSLERGLRDCVESFLDV